jgi:hypothetical protein
MPLQSGDRDADLQSVRALLRLLGEILARENELELYPIADGDEYIAPRGTIEWRLDALDAHRFFFNERFMHVVRSSSPRTVPSER